MNDQQNSAPKYDSLNDLAKSFAGTSVRSSPFRLPYWKIFASNSCDSCMRLHTCPHTAWFDSIVSSMLRVSSCERPGSCDKSKYICFTASRTVERFSVIVASKQEMATIGPIVRNEVFFFVIILGVAGFSVIREWFAARKPASTGDLNPAELRQREWQFRKQRRWSFAAATLCLAVLIMFAADFVYARTSASPARATTVESQNGLIQLPTSTFEDGKLHFYSADVNGTELRFLVVKKGEGQYVTALDACQICGWAGYKQDGQNVICRNCGSAIYIPSIGQAGGCNPVAVKSSVQAGMLAVDLSALADSASSIHH